MPSVSCVIVVEHLHEFFCNRNDHIESNHFGAPAAPHSAGQQRRNFSQCAFLGLNFDIRQSWAAMTIAKDSSIPLLAHGLPASLHFPVSGEVMSGL